MSPPFSELKMVVLLATCFTQVSCLAYSLTLKMEAIWSSKMYVAFQQTAWRYIPEDRTLHHHCRENLKFYIILLVGTAISG
jgi:hypothetical protein